MALRKPLFQAAEGYHEELAITDDIQLGKIALSGVGGVAVDAGSQLITNVATPVSGTDAANKNYVDAAAVGIDWKPSVRVATTTALPTHTFLAGVITASANGALPAQDGVTLVNGERLLVKDEGGGSSLQNGIYVVTDVGSAGTPFILTRSSDADSNAEVTAGLATFVAEGTALSDTGWVLVTNDPIVLNTTALSLTQFTGTGSITAGVGLSKTGNQLDVELDTAAGAQTAGNGGGSSGLEFDTAGIAGKLRAAVHTTGGLSRTASGLAALLNGTTLQSSASGLSVKGLPALFEVATVAVGATVTAPNLDTLTNASNADALHDHEALTMLRVANGAIAKGDGVYYSANDQVSTGDATNDAKSRIVGVANAAILTTATGKVKKSGVVSAVLTGAVFNTRYFLGSTGQPVLVGALPAGARTIQLGIAKNATDLEVAIFDFGKKAA